jgi:hypothetical protein
MGFYSWKCLSINTKVLRYRKKNFFNYFLNYLIVLRRKNVKECFIIHAFEKLQLIMKSTTCLFEYCVNKRDFSWEKELFSDPTKQKTNETQTLSLKFVVFRKTA